jgi:hypothetical protein
MIESCNYTVSTVDCEQNFFPGVIDIVTNTGYLTEWLRWWTRNPLGNSRVGSNPAVVGDNDFRQNFQHLRGGPSSGHELLAHSCHWREAGCRKKTSH